MNFKIFSKHGQNLLRRKNHIGQFSQLKKTTQKYIIWRLKSQRIKKP